MKRWKGCFYKIETKKKKKENVSQWDRFSKYDSVLSCITVFLFKRHIYGTICVTLFSQSMLNIRWAVIVASTYPENDWRCVQRCVLIGLCWLEKLTFPVSCFVGLQLFWSVKLPFFFLGSIKTDIIGQNEHFTFISTFPFSWFSFLFPISTEWIKAKIFLTHRGRARERKWEWEREEDKRMHF